jgi:RNA polymerase sigma-70 factor (ECF subfamily)
MGAGQSEAGGESLPAAQFTEQLAAARDGDGGELGEILDGFREYLLLVANQEVPSEVRPKVAPSDIVQQTFIEAEIGLDDFRGTTPEQFRGWLRRILLHNVTDAERQFCATEMRQVDREVRIGEATESTPGLDVAGHEHSPISHAIEHEDAERVATALEKLPPDYRRVVVLRNLEERSFVEIGQIMNRSRAAVCKLWSRAVLQLGQLLEEYDELSRSTDAERRA